MPSRKERGGRSLQDRQIKIGAVLSYLSMGLSTVISLVYTPIMIQRLGDSEFGVYQTVLPIISYLNLLSFGLGSAYIRYYSRAKSADDKPGMAKLNGMFFTTYVVLGALVLAIGFLLAGHGEIIFGKKLTAEEIALGEKLLRIMTVNAALSFPISVFESHVTINEEYIFQKVVALGRQVLNPLHHDPPADFGLPQRHADGAGADLHGGQRSAECHFLPDKAENALLLPPL